MPTPKPMTAFIPYGTSSRIEIDLPPERLIATCGAPASKPLDDPAAATAAALVDPLGYPPLAEAVFPGDRVVLALDSHVPRAASIVAGVIDVLVEGGVAPNDVGVLLPPTSGHAPADPRRLLPESIREAVACEIHDPLDRSSLSYLAASAEGRPIYLHRALHEADLVFPIGCLRTPESLDHYGIMGGLFPAFSDQATLDRHAAAGFDGPRPTWSGDEAKEVGWLLGVRFVVQVVPAGAGEVLHVLAGDVDAVRPRGEVLCRDAWSHAIPERARLVVATIEGDAHEQTWDNVARALAAAARAVHDDGAVALCTDLDTPPGPALARLARARGGEAASVDRFDAASSDQGAADQLAAALDRGSVYFLSRLDDDLVEDLGMAPISSAEQVARLATRYETCTLLSNAQLAVPTVAGE